MGGETSKPPPRTLLPPSFYAPAALHELLLSPGLASVFSARERRDLFESYYANVRHAWCPPRPRVRPTDM